MSALKRILLGGIALVLAPFAAGETPRETIARATLAEQNAQRIEILNTLIGQGDEAIKPLLDAWKEDALFIYTPPSGTKTPVQLSGDKDGAGSQTATLIATGQPLLDTADYPVGRPVTDRQFDELRLTRHAFHPDWNYTLLPRPDH